MKIKQDINFLEKPLWFQTDESDENGTVWKDLNGYIYRASYKLPDKTDMLILLFFLLTSQENDYQSKLNFSQYEILKACDFSNSSWYRQRLKDSIKRWSNITIEFSGTFYDGKEYLSKIFHILDNAEIQANDKRVYIEFNENFLVMIESSNFFKYIYFNYYKALKRPLSRRLFEILCKTFKGRDIWEIDLVKLGTKLTLSKRKIYSKKEDEKKVMYHSDVLGVLKPAINEINNLAENKALFKSLEIPIKEAFAIDYELRKENKVICFSKRIPKWVQEQPVLETKPKIQAEIVDGTTLKQLYAISKNQTKTVKEVIAKAYQEKDYEYVRWNILYANQEAKTNYTFFLKQALKENWGAEFRDNKEQKTNIEKAVQEEKNSSLREGLKKDAEIEKLDTLYYALPEETQKTLWDSAVQDYLNNGVPISFKMPKRMVLAKIHEWLKNQALSGKK